jgi:hypothetical protein
MLGFVHTKEEVNLSISDGLLRFQIKIMLYYGNNQESGQDLSELNGSTSRISLTRSSFTLRTP